MTERLRAKYNIGDTVWWARTETVNDYVTCPDCGGTAQITVLMYDGTKHSIECEGCKRGWNRATGKVSRFKRTGMPISVEITGLEIHKGEVRYHITGSRLIDEQDLFLTREEALEKGNRDAAELEEQHKKAVLNKEKPTKSWSWHVHYHRDVIRRLKKDIEYHESRLSVAKVKAKDTTSK